MAIKQKKDAVKAQAPVVAPVAAPEPNKTVDLAQFKCPICGSQHFKLNQNVDYLDMWCGSCGANYSSWCTDKNIEAAKAYAKKHRKATVKAPGSTPRCKNPINLVDGTFAECGSQDWVHDGTKLNYCGKCGANFTGPQPENVAEIIKVSKMKHQPPALLGHVMATDKDIASVKSALEGAKRIDPKTIILD